MPVDCRLEQDICACVPTSAAGVRSGEGEPELTSAQCASSTRDQYLISRVGRFLLESDLLKVPALTLSKSVRRLQLRIDQRISGSRAVQCPNRPNCNRVIRAATYSGMGPFFVRKQKPTS